jgi:hypothetical protein
MSIGRHVDRGDPGDQAGSVAQPSLAMDIFCISSDVDVTKPNAAPVVDGLAQFGGRHRNDKRRENRS